MCLDDIVSYDANENRKDEVNKKVKSVPGKTTGPGGEAPLKTVAEIAGAKLFSSITKRCSSSFKKQVRSGSVNLVSEDKRGRGKTYSL